MKTPVVIAALSAGLVAADLLPQPPNFPDCGKTCFGNMLNQASQLGCKGGSDGNDVDGVCLCRNVDFTYGIIDCSNAACPQGVAESVVQYGVDWCANLGVVVGGLSVTAEPSFVSSATVTVSATASSSDAASASTSEGATATTTASGDSTETPVATASVTPISTIAIVSTLTNSDGSVVTSTVGSSTIFSTTVVSDTTGTESGSTTVTESSTLVTQVTRTTDGTTDVATSTLTVPVSTSTEGTDVTSTESDAGALQTAAPVGLVAAAGLAVLLL